tara:strand:- start:1097 stop:1741 length:645 start_codon:yes stop_codon:yes gene_type:complete
MINEITKRIISSIFLVPIIFFCIIKGSYFFYFLLVVVFFIASFEWHSMSKNKSHYFYGYSFLIISIFSVYQLRIDSGNEFWTLLIITIICILTDIGGFVFGKIFKGPKLIKYSPNKTYSGLIGSYLLPLLFIPFILSFYFINNFEIFNLIIFIFLVSSASQFGDIVISYFKRLSNIKDTGKIIPGHGGLLDRIDGMLFAFPFSYLLISSNLFNF